MVDVVVIGAGVAGISAALWLDDLSVPFRWLEATDRLGGTLHQVHNPLSNCALGRTFEEGGELVEALRRQLEGSLHQPELGCRVHRLQADGPESPWRVELADEAIVAHVVIIATGTARRRLGVPGEDAARGHGLLESGRKNIEAFDDRCVVIVGGGDAAFENALMAAPRASSVTVVHRSDVFQARPEFVAKVEVHPNVTVLEHSEVREFFVPDGALCRVSIQTPEGLRTLKADVALVRIGVTAVVPRTVVAGETLELSSDGFAKPGPHPKHPTLIFAGDCACADFRAVPVALGQGASAARAAAATLGFG